MLSFMSIKVRDMLNYSERILCDMQIFIYIKMPPLNLIVLEHSHGCHDDPEMMKPTEHHQPKLVVC